MSGDARDFNNIETRSVNKFFFFQDKAPKEIQAILKETLGDMHHSMPPSKTGWPSLNVLIFPPVMRAGTGRPKRVTTPEIIDQIHELILDDQRISAKSIAEQLGISSERVGSIIHEDLDIRNLSAKWVPKCLNADQKRKRCQSSEQLLEFFRRNSNDYLSVAFGEHGRNMVISL